MTWLRPLTAVTVPLSVIGWAVWQRIRRVLPPDPEYRYRQQRDALARASRPPRSLP